MGLRLDFVQGFAHLVPIYDHEGFVNKGNILNLWDLPGLVQNRMLFLLGQISKIPGTFNLDISAEA